MSVVVIAAAWGVIPAYAVTSSDEDIQTINLEVSASDAPFTFKLDAVKGLKPGFVIDGASLAKGVISGGEPQQYAVEFDNPQGLDWTTVSGRNPDNKLKVKFSFRQRLNNDANHLGDWYIFPVGSEVNFEVQKYDAAMVNADVYSIMVHAGVYTP